MPVSFSSSVLWVWVWDYLCGWEISLKSLNTSWHVMIHRETSWYVTIHHDMSWHLMSDDDDLSRMMTHDVAWHMMTCHDRCWSCTSLRDMTPANSTPVVSAKSFLCTFGGIRGIQIFQIILQTWLSNHITYTDNLTRNSILVLPADKQQMVGDAL